MANFANNVSDIRLSRDDGNDCLDHVECAMPTGISVLVVGAGVGGLTAAIECHRQGHTVQVLERTANPSAGGDMFTIGASALRLLEHYPGMQRDFNDVCPQNLWMRFKKWTGENIGGDFPFGRGAPGAEKWQHQGMAPMTTQLRPRFHAMLYKQLEKFGIKVEFSKRVVEYYEDLERRIGGVVTDKGERFEADIVIAADGLHSRSKAIIPGSPVEIEPPGRTAFRTTFPLEVATADPVVNETFGLKDGRYPMLQAWLGPNIHAVLLSYVDQHGKYGRMCYSIVVTDESGKERPESWHAAVSSNEVLGILDGLPGFGEALKRLVKITPEHSIIAWPLNPRNPYSCWHSPGARILQLGDAGHAFLPSSGNGASQAMEDGVSIAACLAQSGREDVPAAVRVHNLLRADRVSCAQLLGFVNAARMQKTDWNAVGDDASKVQPKVPRWIWSHRPEQYVYENYAAAARSLDSDGPIFLNTNIPPGHISQPWTIDEVVSLQKTGQKVELTGDWS